MVPAEAELVLEGRIDARRTIEEGLVSEYHGMYENYGSGYLATFGALTRRERRDHSRSSSRDITASIMYLAALPIAAGLLEAVPAVAPMCATSPSPRPGAGRTDIVVQLGSPRAGQAREVIFALFGAASIVKRVTVVDDDVDPWDPSRSIGREPIACVSSAISILAPIRRAVRSEPMEPDGTGHQSGLRRHREAGRPGRGATSARCPCRRAGGGEAVARGAAARRSPPVAEVKPRIVVAISGASGAIYGITALKLLRELGAFETHLVISPAGARTILRGDRFHAGRGRGTGRRAAMPSAISRRRSRAAPSRSTACWWRLARRAPWAASRCRSATISSCVPPTCA